MKNADPSRARRSTLLALIVAALVTLLTAPAASAAPALDVTLKGGATEVQVLNLRAIAGGQFRLRFGDGGAGIGETQDIEVPADVIDDLSGISLRAFVAQVAAELNALSNVSDGGGTVLATGSITGLAVQLRLQFDGGLRGVDVPELVPVDGTSPLTSTLPAKVSVDTIEEAVIRRDDQMISYAIGVRNTTAATTTATVGQTLACDTKESKWIAGSALTVTAEWHRNGVPIPGEDGMTYTVAPADAGTAIQCVAVAASAYTTIRTAGLPAVVADPQPAISPPTPSSRDASGSRPRVVVGDEEMRTCSVDSLNWVEDADGDPETAPTPLPAESYTFQWWRDGEEIAGATEPTYAPVTSGGDPDTGRVLQCRVVGTNAGGALVGFSDFSSVGGFSELPPLLETDTPQIVDPSATSGPVTVTVELPAGVAASSADVYNPLPGSESSAPNGWSCASSPPSGGDPAKVTCTRSDTLDPQQSYPEIGLGIRLDPDLPAPASITVTATGGSASPATTGDSFAIAPALPFGLVPGSFWTKLLDSRGEESVKAGTHPWATTAQVSFGAKRGPYRKTVAYQVYRPTGHARVVRTDAPAGLVGNALAPDVLCDDPFKVLSIECPVESIVGEARYRSGAGWAIKGIVALEPERGAAAQFAFGDPTTRGVYVLTAELRPEDGYALRVETAPLGQSPELYAVGASLCSYGADVRLQAEYQVTGCKQPGDPGAFSKPLLTNPTTCTAEPLVTRMSMDSWENPGVFSTLSTEEPSMTRCHQVPFTPTVAMSPTSDTADSPSGLDASIDVPVDGFEDPYGTSQSHLKKTVVTLPEGVSVNPSAATGLQGCSDEQLGLKTDSEPACPEGSKLGTVEATTPALEETLSGVMVLRTPKGTDPMSGEMFRVALIVRNDERGILVKLPGSATADPRTGRLVATFDDNPQLPIGHVEVHVRGGDKGVLAMPRDCGEVSTKVALTPWSGNADAISDTPTDVDQRCGDGFAPKLSAGSSDNRARGQGGTYSFKFSREDGEQWLRGLTAQLPKGLLASVKDVPLCSNQAADAGNCPASSKIGVVDAKAGVGDPFVLEEKGEVFLTEGYKGGEYGLAVKIRPVAGPFRGEYELSPIVVRQAIHVDRTTAEVSAVSDPFPLIHHGIPLRTREVHVLVNRGGFMVNPSDCDQKQSSATLVSDEGTTAGFSDPFQVSGCANLPFNPKLTLALTGPKQVTTGKHPGIKAVVTQQGTSEAGIEKAVVRLPKSLALDPNNAQALCEFADGTKPDLENRCPKGSIVGRARAKTPLLRDDLVGNVYFVKNVRKDPVTGNEIRTLPMIVVALRGEIAINLRGESDTTKSGKLVNTFNAVPDAPITQFNLNIKGGAKGIIAVTRTRRAKINLCAGRHVAEADIDGHNGRRNDTDVRMKTPCTKKQAARAKRAAAKASRA